MALQGSCADLGHAVEGLAGEFCAEVECRGSGGECDGVLAADFLRDEFFQFVDVRTDGAHPVGFIRFGDVLDLVPMHCGT